MQYRATLPLTFAIIYAATALFGVAACPAQERPDQDAAIQSPDNQNSNEGELLFRKRRSAGSRTIQMDGLSDSFLLGVVEVSQRIGCRPGDLLAVMMRESSLRPDSWNRSSHAAGLIQFLPSTLAKLGWSGTWEDFTKLSAEQQLPWVEKYLRPYSRYGLNTAGRLYQAVFMPASLRVASNADTSLIESRGANDGRYQNNRGLDLNGDGRITVGELHQSVERGFRTSGWQALEARLTDLGQGGRGTRNASARPSAEQDWTDYDRPTGAWTGRQGELASRGSSSRAGARPAQYRDNDDGSRGSDERVAVDLGSTEGLTDALAALGFNTRRSSLNSAVQAFQRHVGLSADGILGPRTRAAIEAELQSAGLATAM